MINLNTARQFNFSITSEVMASRQSPQRDAINRLEDRHDRPS